MLALCEHARQERLDARQRRAHVRMDLNLLPVACA
jgi:hypothetical protein